MTIPRMLRVKLEHPFCIKLPRLRHRSFVLFGLEADIRKDPHSGPTAIFAFSPKLSFCQRRESHIRLVLKSQLRPKLVSQSKGLMIANPLFNRRRCHDHDRTSSNRTDCDDRDEGGDREAKMFYRIHR